MSTYDQVTERFEDSDVPELQVLVGTALFYKGITQGRLGDSRAAMPTYDQVTERGRRTRAGRMAKP